MEESGENISNHENLSDDFSIPPFSVKEAQLLSEKLDAKETRGEAIYVLQYWLETGQCNDSNSNIFFSLIEKSYSLILDLKKNAEELKKAKENICLADEVLSKIMCGLTLMEQEEEIRESLTPFQRKDLNVMKSDILECRRLNSGIEEKQNKEPSSEYSFTSPIDQYTARIISLISVLLFEKHPSALNLFEIHSNLTIYLPTVMVSHIEFALRKCPESFKETEDGKWVNLYADSLIHLRDLAPKRFP